MLRVKKARYKDLPAGVDKESLPDNCAKEYANYLLIYDGMELIRVESDDMAREDASFSRDLRWIEKAINQAYKIGFRDGKKIGSIKL